MSEQPPLSSPSSSSPSSLVICAPLEPKRKLQSDLAAGGRRLYELEGHILAEPFNVVSGFAGFHKGPAVHATRAVPPEERIFSLSSLTSPVGDAPWPAAALDATAASGSAATGATQQ